MYFSDCPLHGTRYIHGDAINPLARHVFSYQECQYKCQQSPTCNFFSYFTENYSKTGDRYACLLKVAITKNLTSNGMVSGPKFCNSTSMIGKTNVSGNMDFAPLPVNSSVELKDGCYEEETAYTFARSARAEIKGVGSYQACQLKCKQESSCNYFSYASHKSTVKRWRGRCFLKVAILARRKAVGVLSGPKHCPSGSLAAAANYSKPVVSSATRFNGSAGAKGILMSNLSKTLITWTGCTFH